MSTQTEHEVAKAEPELDLSDPRLTRFDLVREGARRDGVEIVHYAPRFPVPGTRAERRVERSIALMLLLSGLCGAAFVWVYSGWGFGFLKAWDFRYEPGSTDNKWFTPLLGLTLGGALLFLGFAIATWAKKLLPEEVSIQDRHDGASPSDERLLTGATLANLADETGIKRRPLLKGALLAGIAPLGVATVAPIIGGLIKDPHHPDVLMHTGWKPLPGGEKVKLAREDGSPVRPEDVSVGGQITVFPGIPHGASNHYADSPALLIHLRADDARLARENLEHRRINHDSMWGNFVAYSKICTHAGCPASLYEQRTNRLLCPCHQSQFDITDNAVPIFGPATRKLPMLPLEVENGFLVAKSDFREPIGPGFWERA